MPIFFATTIQADTAMTASRAVLRVCQFMTFFPNGITDVVCVVTRYFGGILLGTGGLVHAYSKGASMALANAEIVNMEVADSLKISCDYTMYGIVNSVLPEFESIIRDTEFTDSVCIYLDVKTELTESLTAKLTDRCNGKVKIEKLKSGYVEF